MACKYDNSMYTTHIPEPIVEDDTFDIHDDVHEDVDDLDLEFYENQAREIKDLIKSEPK